MSSQGTTVSFAGSPIGSLLSVVFTPGSAATVDITSTSSTVTGSGSGAIIKKEIDCTGIEPGTATITMIGGAGLAVGSRGALSIAFGGGTSFSVNAFVSRQETSATVGDLLKGTVEFQLTGT